MMGKEEDAHSLFDRVISTTDDLGLLAEEYDPIRGCGWEAHSPEWPQVRLNPVQEGKFGFVTVLSGKAKSRKSRNVPLSARLVEMFRRWGPKQSGFIFVRQDGKS